MKMQVTTSAPTFKPVTVELTFESLEELLVMKTLLGIASGACTYERIEEFHETTGVNLNAGICDRISEIQYNFFNELYQLNK
jgi:hypothetical protein